jgi:hypothetical protein
VRSQLNARTLGGNRLSLGDGLRRPLGFTLLAVHLSWYAFGGVLLVVSALAGARGANVRWATLGVAGALLATTSAFAARALWRVHSWAHKAFIGWLAGLFLFGALLALSIQVPPDLRARQAVLSGSVLVGVLGALCSRYIRRNLLAA